MRCFIAIDIDEQAQTALARLQEELQQGLDIKKGGVKWVKPEAAHLTLKFLGQVKDRQLPEICTALEKVAARHDEFELTLESLGTFGGRSPRVAWVGTTQGKEALCDIQGDIESEMEKLGWGKEKRKFTGHLTICRIKNAKAGFQIKQKIDEHRDFTVGSFEVERICLYQSELTPEGPLYTALGCYNLR